jgi:hypothetical protein
VLVYHNPFFPGSSSDGLVKNNNGNRLMLNVLQSDGEYVDTFNVGLNTTITSRTGLP